MKTPTRPNRAGAIGLCALGVLWAAGSGAAAAEFRAIASIRRVDPGPGGPSRRPVLEEDELRRTLAPFLGGACEPSLLREALARPYRFLGYVPQIEIDCAAGDVAIVIRESSHRIDLIAFDPGELSGIGVSPAGAAGDDHPALFPVPDAAPRDLIRALLRTRPGDLYNHVRYRDDVEALRPVGYTVAFIPGAPADGGAYPRGAYLVQSLTPRRPDGGPPPGDRNYVGGTASFNPRAGGEAGLVYSRRAIFGGLDSLTIAPTWSGALGGRIAYAAPYLSRRSEPRRAYDLEVSASSTYVRDRLLGAEEVDERRSVGRVGLGVRPLTLAPSHDLQWQFSIRHERVDLETVVDGIEETALTLFRFGWTHLARHTTRRPSLSLRILPFFDVALDAAGGEQEFIRGSLDATLQQRLPTGIDLHFHLAGGGIDRPVPSFELWSLGGVESVRGFEEDTLLGRHRVALQSEIWFPFVRALNERPVVAEEVPSDPGLAPLQPRAAGLFRGALFVDGGYISGTTTGDNATLIGAGLGIRFIIPRQPLVLRIDYGWGIGGRGGDAFPYLSMGYRF
jgi:hypothetical protein